MFLDTTTIESVHPAARREYERRHPGVAYDAAFSRFLIQLRRKMPKGLIFTNQGYRSAENYLPYADFDLTESLITWPRGGSFALRPWNDPKDPWNSILFLMRNVVEPLTQRYPRVRFSHLNYIDRASPDAVRVGLAVARLFETDAYLAAPQVSDEIDPLYLYDFGAPVAPRVDRNDGDVTYRLFEHGIIAISTSVSEVTLDDVPRKGEHVTLPATPGEPRAFFFAVDR